MNNDRPGGILMIDLTQLSVLLNWTELGNKGSVIVLMNSNVSQYTMPLTRHNSNNTNIETLIFIFAIKQYAVLIHK